MRSLAQLEYLLDCKAALDPASMQWDIFISAYNDSERVKTIFTQVKAQKKYWVSIPEYDYEDIEIPNDGIHLTSTSRNEADFVAESISPIKDDLIKSRVCIDITGFMRPHILYILYYFKTIGLNSFDVLYSEPQHYKRKEDTEFTVDGVKDVRQINGYEGIHNMTDHTNDILIVGVGYDHDLISRTIMSKDAARLIQLRSLPSLSADMYQESILRLERASSAIGNVADDTVYFSSANDPYVTAAVLSEAYQKISKYRAITNLYLCPLATKVQALGFGLFYQRELVGQSASIIFPFSTRYNRETTGGLGRSWVYPILL
jgi:hypothetical protein